MRGIITTQHKAGAMLMPVSAPIVYARRSSFQGLQLGEVRPADTAFAEYHAILRETIEQGYARMLTVADHAAK